MNTIRQAILKAADSIEQHPELFNFHSVSLPHCDSPGCALGWIAVHLNSPELLYSTGSGWWSEKLNKIMGTRGDAHFYQRMRNLYGGFKWRYTAKNCAKTLRKYADKYHPESAIPASVLAIFKVTETVQ